MISYVRIAVTCMLTFAAAVNFWSCSKNGGETTCDQIMKTRISMDKTEFTHHRGESIVLKTNIVPSVVIYRWSHDQTAQYWDDPTVTINPCTKNDEGWYYVSVSNPDCTSMIDSIYISVINSPASPDCSPSNNTVSFTSIPNISFNRTNWDYDGDFNAKLLHGEPASGDQSLNIYFNPYWTTHELEDGAYNIYNILDYDEADNKYGVYMVSRYSGIDFESTGGKVYVSHVNNKLKVTFCSVTFNGYNGNTSFTTEGTSAITAP